LGGLALPGFLSFMLDKNRQPYRPASFWEGVVPPNKSWKGFGAGNFCRA